MDGRTHEANERVPLEGGRETLGEGVRGRAVPLCSDKRQDIRKPPRYTDIFGQIILTEFEKRHFWGPQNRLCGSPGGVRRGWSENLMKKETAWLVIVMLPQTNSMNLGRRLDCYFII